MSLLDALRVALRGVRRRRGRATLTVIAVALAATLLTALLLISNTAEARVLSQLAKGGPLTGIRVSPSSPGPEGVSVDNPAHGVDRPIDDVTVAQVRAVRGVRRVTTLTTVGVLVDATGLPVGPDGVAVPRFADGVIGVDLRHAADLPITVITGRLPAIGSRTEIAVTESYLRRLGRDRHDAAPVIGTGVVMATPRGDAGGGATAWWWKATVVGVVAQEAASGMGVMSEEVVREAYVWQATSAVGPQSTGTTAEGTYSALYVEATSLDQVGSVRAAIADIGYVTSASEHIIESVGRYLHVVDIVLSGVGLIAVGIACIGITNAMLSAVRERQREIGVIKAIGARDRDVLAVFLIEAGILGAVGGVLGTALGWLIARVVGETVNRFLIRQALSGVAFETPVAVLLASVLGATLLALLAGVVPARRAARLSAKEAVDAT